MSDEAAKAWGRIAKSLVSQLPGEWTTGRSGIRMILVRKPVDWVLVWAGLDRTRRDSDPYLIGGEVALVEPFVLSAGHGLRSDDVFEYPSRVDLTAPTAPEIVEKFITEHLLPRVEEWTPDRMAAEAEDQLGIPEEERGGPLVYPSAAGWRVVNDTGSPVEPASRAAAWYQDAYSPDDASWYNDLIRAWKDGGRPAALKYLEDQRATALAGLKLK